MEELFDAITNLVSLVSPEKIQAIANRIKGIESTRASYSLSSMVSTPNASNAMDKLTLSWQMSGIGSEEVSSMLLVASHMHESLLSREKYELVLSGPNTPFISTRKTEQALLEVINSANHSLFIVSFVVYDIPSIIKALLEAQERSVKISILVELSQESGGSLSFDVVALVSKLVPEALLYVWDPSANTMFYGGSVHAKLVVADKAKCLLTSANLTGKAFDKNLEAGIMITGGVLPISLQKHLEYLVSMNIIKRV